MQIHRIFMLFIQFNQIKWLYSTEYFIKLKFIRFMIKKTFIRIEVRSFEYFFSYFFIPLSIYNPNMNNMKIYTYTVYSKNNNQVELLIMIYFIYMTFIIFKTINNSLGI